MARVYLSLGSNIESRKGYLEKGVKFLNELGVLKNCSRVYETQPQDVVEQPDFLNLVLELESDLTANLLLGNLIAFEKQIGKKIFTPKGPRVLDIDILDYDQQVFEKQGLILPHPSLCKRAFVLDPLAEINPDWIHPENKKNVLVLKKELNRVNQRINCLGFLEEI
jgi:dihydroneopterin aldolase / 2-amino-4-hydroxy-6-hydroxymethyldihydropteridine diphosphokinase